MVLHLLAWIASFAMTAGWSATVTITPLAFAFTFGNILTFALFLIPAYIGALVLLWLGFMIFGGIFVGGAVGAASLMEKRMDKHLRRF